MILGPCQQDSLLPWVSGLWSPLLYSPLLSSCLPGPLSVLQTWCGHGVTSQAPAQPVSTVHGRHLESGSLPYLFFPQMCPSQEARSSVSHPLVPSAASLPHCGQLAKPAEATMITQLHAVAPPRYLLIQHTGDKGSQDSVATACAIGTPL